MIVETLILISFAALAVVFLVVGGFLAWIVRDLNRDDDDAAAARKGEQSVEMWGRK